MQNSIFIGWDPREAAAYAVARSSLKRYLTQPIQVYGLLLDNLIEQGVYTRPIDHHIGASGASVMWDVISEAPMATEFAVSRFMVPELAQGGWALFCDCDMLFRSNVARLFASLDPKYAVYCVKHDYKPKSLVKMDGQTQTSYSRKLWSSFCIFNVDHKSNKLLTNEMVNTIPGRNLHAFEWLKDDEIGSLGEEWNWIPGHSPWTVDPKCVHFSEGGPWFHGYENVPFADEWRRELLRWAA